jgi:hypothetical protein
MFKPNKTESAILRLIERARSHQRFITEHDDEPNAREEIGLDHLVALIKQNGLREEKKGELGVYIK